MAKKSQSSSSTTTVGVLSGIFIVLMALIAQFFLGVDVLDTEDTNDDTIVVDDNGGGAAGPQNVDIANSGETVITGSGYRLYFTEPINTSDRSLHTGSVIEADILEAINSATTSIDGAFYEMNLERVANALVAAEARGVQVRLIVDDEDFVHREELEPDNSVLDIFEAAGFQLYCEDEQPRSYEMRCDDRGSNLMHNKFMIIDSTEVWTGSMNYTHNGIYNNNNNVLIFRSQAMVANYEYMFDLMFEDGVFNAPGTSGNTLPNPRPRVSGIQIENYFSPDDGRLIESRTVEIINGAQESIYVMTYGVTLDTIGEAIVDRHKDGVTVQGLFETRAATATGSQFPVMGCAGISVKRDGNPNTFHHKAIIIDGEIVITGSFNFSGNAQNNSENVTIIYSAEIAQQFVSEFNRRFNDPAANTLSRAQMGCS